jgi:hypothetical protein
MDILLFIITNILLGVLCAIPAIVFGRVLDKKGILREEDPTWLIASTIGVIFIGRFLFPNDSVGYLVLFASLLTPLVAYRADLSLFIRKGKFPEDE